MFHSIEEIVNLSEKNNLPLSEVVLQSEIKVNLIEREVLVNKMLHRLEIMRKSSEKGLKKPVRSLSGMNDGNAFQMWNQIQSEKIFLGGNIFSEAISRALSVGEVNAGMGCIVATPTAGSAGVLPSVLFSLQSAYQFSDEQLVKALFTAGGIGSVIAYRAHIAGAAGGCQAEIGTAAAMTSGAVVELLGGSPRQSSHAIAITLSNMLGLVCDPVGGLVEVPCIIRNAGGVGQVFTAVNLAMAGIPFLIPADEVIDAMERIGQHMDYRLRETAQGGLAITPTGRALAAKIWGKSKEAE